MNSCMRNIEDIFLILIIPYEIKLYLTEICFTDGFTYNRQGSMNSPRRYQGSQQGKYFKSPIIIISSCSMCSLSISYSRVNWLQQVHSICEQSQMQYEQNFLLKKTGICQKKKLKTLDYRIQHGNHYADSHDGRQQVGGHFDHGYYGYVPGNHHHHHHYHGYYDNRGEFVRGRGFQRTENQSESPDGGVSFTFQMGNNFGAYEYMQVHINMFFIRVNLKEVCTILR